MSDMMTKVRGIPVSYGDAEFWIYHFITPKAPEKEVKKYGVTTHMCTMKFMSS